MNEWKLVLRVLIRKYMHVKKYCIYLHGKYLFMANPIHLRVSSLKTNKKLILGFCEQINHFFVNFDW